MKFKRDKQTKAYDCSRETFSGHSPNSSQLSLGELGRGQNISDLHTCKAEKRRVEHELQAERPERQNVS